MPEAALPPDLTEKFWARVRILNVAPASQKPEAFRSCAHDVRHLIGPILSPAAIADRLYEVALSTGIVLEWGEEAVQTVLTEALVSSDDFDEEGRFDDDDVRAPEFSDEALALRFALRSKNLSNVGAHSGSYVPLVKGVI